MGLSLEVRPGDVIVLNGQSDDPSDVVKVTMKEKSGRRGRLLIEADRKIDIKLQKQVKDPTYKL